MAETCRAPRTRGYRKKERTRRQLVAAGLHVLAHKGHGLTVSDVVAEAGVSNGTFYNYFTDRDDLIEAVVAHTALDLVTAAAEAPIEDAARRFAVATTRVLVHARDDEDWARVILRLVGRPGASVDLSRYLREDLAMGHAQGRFDTGPDDATLDLIGGLVIMTIRRMLDGQAGPDTPQQAVARGLRTLGVQATEARALAAEAEVVEKEARRAASSSEGSRSRGGVPGAPRRAPKGAK
jgi:AcrR family transcriptional regulator